MRISAYCYTNRGGRDHNEDSVRCSAEAGAFVLADGLGGHGKGEVASALAADVLFEGCAAHPGPEELLELFQRANGAVLEGQKLPGQEEMKTTAVVLSLAGERAVWGHVGDSRLYRFSGGTLAQETRDMEGGLILREGSVEVNCAFETELRVLRESMAAEIAAILFP